MKILFCSDGSAQAEKGVRFGAQIAAACQAEASILGIAESVEDEDELLKALRREQKILHEHRVEAELITKVGRPVREIIKRTREVHYDLVVIGAVYKNPFLRLISPAAMSVQVYEIIESVKPPVLAFIGDRHALKRILLCSSGTERIDRAIEFAGKIAQEVKAVIDLFHAMPEPPAMSSNLIRVEEDVARLLDSDSKLGRTLRHQTEMLEKLGVFGRVRLRLGAVVPQLLEELKQNDYDLIVTGSSPAEGVLAKYVLGSTARKIVDYSEMPVLVIRTGYKSIFGFIKGIASQTWGRFRKTSGKMNAESH